MGPMLSATYIHKNMISFTLNCFLPPKKVNNKTTACIIGLHFSASAEMTLGKWNFLLKLIWSQLVRSYTRKNIDSDMTDIRSCRSILRDWKIAKTWNKKLREWCLLIHYVWMLSILDLIILQGSFTKLQQQRSTIISL